MLSGLRRRLLVLHFISGSGWLDEAHLREQGRLVPRVLHRGSVGHDRRLIGGLRLVPGLGDLIEGLLRRGRRLLLKRLSSSGIVRGQDRLHHLREDRHVIVAGRFRAHREEFGHLRSGAHVLPRRRLLRLLLDRRILGDVRLGFRLHHCGCVRLGFGRRRAGRFTLSTRGGSTRPLLLASGTLGPQPLDLLIRRHLKQACREETVDDARNLEVGAAHLLGKLTHRARTVDQKEQVPLHGLQRDLEGSLARSCGHLEDHVSRRDLLLDAVPLLEPPAALHDDVLNGDRQADVLVQDLRQDLEVEVAFVPPHDVEDRVLDLLLDEGLEDVLGDVTLAHQDLAEPALAALGLVHLQRTLQRRRRYPLRAHQPIAEQLMAPVGLREEHLAVAEPDTAFRVGTDDAQHSGLPAQLNELEDVWKTEVLEVAAQCHRFEPSLPRSIV
ncbi:MAG: hypothetical protein XD74_2139 [Actinobacteria bacterium 66_15]|nr:MAG: hypothetical protein XD74_2139 [Actinobacteria bacterium 66_15]